MTAYGIDGTVFVVGVTEEDAREHMHELGRRAGMVICDIFIYPDASTTWRAEGRITGVFSGTSEAHAVGRMMGHVMTTAGVLPQNLRATKTVNTPEEWVL